jgi:hypothetical protein
MERRLLTAVSVPTDDREYSTVARRSYCREFARGNVVQVDEKLYV